MPESSLPKYNLPVPCILALDEGTSSARAALYDESGKRLAMETAPVASAYPSSGWVEQDPVEIWRAQMAAAHRLLAQRNIPLREIAGIGIANQRETTIVWDRKTGQPVAPAIGWQCRRTAEYCRELARSAAGSEATCKTGLVVDAYFSASKIRWILENVPEARARAEAGELLFGTVDTWLVWNLSDGARHVTDYTNASRTMLMDLDSGEWDDGLLRIFGVPRAMLPEICPSSGVLAETGARHFGLEIPIGGIAGDQQAALFGQACFGAGRAKNTYGTGCFALLHTGSHLPVSRNRLVATRAASGQIGGEFALEGSIFAAGAAIQWLRDQLGIIADAAETEAVARAAGNNGGVYMVPAFAGLGAPHWNPEARGLISGLTRATTRAHLVRAAVESIAYQTRDLVTAMEADSGERLTELRADGGASANDFLMQFQADILGCPVVRPTDIETTALGAAYLAGLATGVWGSRDEIEAFWQAERTFEPRMSADERGSLLDGWRRAVARCL